MFKVHNFYFFLKAVLWQMFFFLNQTWSPYVQKVLHRCWCVTCAGQGYKLTLKCLCLAIRVILLRLFASSLLLSGKALDCCSLLRCFTCPCFVINQTRRKKILAVWVYQETDFTFPITSAVFYSS